MKQKRKPAHFNLWKGLALILFVLLVGLTGFLLLSPFPAVTPYDRASGLYLVPDEYAIDTAHDITLNGQTMAACAVAHTDDGTVMSVAPNMLAHCDGVLPERP
jgi:hypothetical protein